MTPDDAQPHPPAASPLPGTVLGRLGHLSDDARRIEERVVPAWLRPTGPENRLPVAVAIVGAAAMQFAIPDKYGLHPRWVIPSLELLLLAVLTVINPIRLTRATRIGKAASLAVVAAITLDNAISAGLLDHQILTSKASGDAIGLLGSGAAIYLTNIIAFGIWYWELDRGGPFARSAASTAYPDFMFPQMSVPALAPPHWEPRFADYLYVSFTNVMAFSPTDTMPLSRWAKTLMAVQSMIALSTIALVIARAVNVLK
ncbi:MAG: hypothetical protein M3O28_05670 [Actinomycetota bacterium]|nr:hypothetical protein [Actinomycetota bacterium]